MKGRRKAGAGEYTALVSARDQSGRGDRSDGSPGGGEAHSRQRAERPGGS